MSPVAVSSIPKRAFRALTPLAVAAGLAAAAAPAQAAAWSYTGTDAKGDGAGPTSIDLIGTTVSYDKATGAFVAKIETAAPFADGLLQVFVGTTTDGVCDYYPDPDGEAPRKPSFQFLQVSIAGLPMEPYTTYSGRSEDDFAPQPAELKTSGNVMTMTTKADATLANLPLDCVYVATSYDNKGQGAVGDTMTGLLVDPTVVPPKTDAAPSGNTPPSGSAPSGTTPATRPPVKVVTTEVDTDRDGTPDGRDACAGVPGAAKNGCPTVKPADEFRLGAKRVVVDRLVPLTAKVCPPRVRINVTSKGRKIGTGVFTVDQHGSFCRVNGIVRLKKKMKKVRVVAKGTGMGATAKSVKR